MKVTVSRIVLFLTAAAYRVSLVKILDEKWERNDLRILTGSQTTSNDRSLASEKPFLIKSPCQGHLYAADCVDFLKQLTQPRASQGRHTSNYAKSKQLLNERDVFNHRNTPTLEYFSELDKKPYLRSKITDNRQRFKRLLKTLNSKSDNLFISTQVSDLKKRISSSSPGSISKTNPRAKRSNNYYDHYPQSKQLRWKMCPNSMNRVNCFEGYVSLWLDLISTGRNGKRTFGPGKRSVREQSDKRWTTAPADAMMGLCAPHQTPAACFHGTVYNLIKHYKQSDEKKKFYNERNARNNAQKTPTQRNQRFQTDRAFPGDRTDKARVFACANDYSGRGSQPEECLRRLVDILARLREKRHRAILNEKKHASTARQGQVGLSRRNYKRQPKPFAAPKRHFKRERNLCPASLSKSKCFEQYLMFYTKHAVHKPRSFVGRSVQINKRVADSSASGQIAKSNICSDDTSDEDCFNRVFVRFIEEISKR